MAPWSLTGAAPKFAHPATQCVDASASLTLPRTWGPLRLTSETPIPSIAATINSPFGLPRLVFAQQTVAPENFVSVTVRKSDFGKGTPGYLETLRPRDLAILLNHMEPRVHGDRPAWAARLVCGEAPALQMLAGRRVLYWEGEWSMSAARTVAVRGHAFFGNGAVYLLRISGTTSGSEPVEFAGETRFADLVAATFHMKQPPSLCCNCCNATTRVALATAPAPKRRPAHVKTEICCYSWNSLFTRRRVVLPHRNTYTS